MKKKRIRLDVPIESIKWPPDLYKLLRSKWFLIEDIWGIYDNDVERVGPGTYVGKQLLGLKGFNKRVYERIDAVLRENGLPSLEESVTMVARNDRLKASLSKIGKAHLVH